MPPGTYLSDGAERQAIPPTLIERHDMPDLATLNRAAEAIRELADEREGRSHTDKVIAECDELRTLANSLERDAHDPGTCLVGFDGEAFDSAARVLESMVGWCVTVYPADGTEPFDAAIRALEVREADGEYLVVLQRWDDGDIDAAGEILRLAAYADIDRIVAT